MSEELESGGAMHKYSEAQEWCPIERWMSDDRWASLPAYLESRWLESVEGPDRHRLLGHLEFLQEMFQNPALIASLMADRPRYPLGRNQPLPHENQHSALPSPQTSDKSSTAA